tara:strand:- start:245 stop:499 length:255 start_codon:yes stop_codon:yes gene_type:complete
MEIPYLPQILFRKIVDKGITDKRQEKHKLLAKRLSWEIGMIFNDSCEDYDIYKWNIKQIKQDPKCHREIIRMRNKIYYDEYKMP